MGKDAQLHLLVAPASGGTLDLEYKDDAWVTLSAGTYKLPDNQKLGVTVNVYATGAVTIQTQAAVTVATLNNGDVASFVATSSTTWKGSGGAASGISIEDDGAFTSATNVEAALAEIYQSDLGTGRFDVPISTILKEDGTAMLKQATTVTGFAQLSNKATTILIPANSTAEAFSFNRILPADCDLTAALSVKIVALKTDTADPLTFDLELYPANDDGSAGTDLYAGAAQTISDSGSTLSYTCSAPGASAIGVSGVITLGGLNDNDQVYLTNVYVTYTKKLLTA